MQPDVQKESKEPAVFPADDNTTQRTILGNQNSNNDVDSGKKNHSNDKNYDPAASNSAQLDNASQPQQQPAAVGVHPDEYVPRHKTVLESREECEEIISRIRESCTKFNNTYQDPDFVASDLAVGDVKLPSPMAYVRWCKVEEKSKINFNLSFDNLLLDLSPSTCCGDSWFLGALALVASRNKIFGGNGAVMVNDLQVPEVGIYTFKFFKNGKWQFVIIDNMVPYLVDDNCETPLGGSINLVNENGTDSVLSSHQFWILLAEKAYAKLFGSYAKLFSGFLDEALVDLTGAPVEKHSLAKRASNPGALWMELFNATNSGRNMNMENPVGNSRILACLKAEAGGGAKTQNFSAQFDEARFVHVDGSKIGQSGLFNTGLVRNMAYAVLQFAVVNGQKAVQLRPLLADAGRWRGRGVNVPGESANSLKPDGSFWMLFQDWLLVFSNFFAVLDVSSMKRHEFADDC